MTAEQGE